MLKLMVQCRANVVNGVKLLILYIILFILFGYLFVLQLMKA
ncbi:hypothetical protein JOC48_002857 [Aquibacillus albus]|uniref:Uncharacterized protein n=1 Tax=Aquibacillus albus TaxID=1168171 RepID=A0ABS2N2N6_9BACI|nr:hypothetical protein [Aquibacillus albus]